MLTNTTYDIMKKLVTMWLPALGMFIMALDKIWGLGISSEKINESIIALCTFLGVILNISSYSYYKVMDNE